MSDSDRRIQLADRSDAYNFHRGMPLRMDVRPRPYRWYRRAWARLWLWRRPESFGRVAEVDVDAGAITVEYVEGRWSFWRWKWVPAK
jgi:hypothetical protein